MHGQNVSVGTALPAATPLTLAVSGGHLSCVNLLLENKHKSTEDCPACKENLSEHSIKPNAMIASLLQLRHQKLLLRWAQESAEVEVKEHVQQDLYRKVEV